MRREDVPFLAFEPHGMLQSPNPPLTSSPMKAVLEPVSSSAMRPSAKLTINPTCRTSAPNAKKLETTLPTVQAMIELDLAVVTYSLASVSLEVLAFYSEYGIEFRQYERLLRQLLLFMSQLNASDQGAVLGARREELTDIQEALRRRTRLSFKLRRLIAFGLRMTGAALNFGSGNAIGGIGNSIGAIGNLPGGENFNLGAYSYIFAVQETWKDR